MPGPLKNPKHERFAQAIVKGETLDAAYVKAGYARNEKNAARLKKYEGVEARIAELQERIAVRVEITTADIAAQLDEDREFARTHKQSAAAVSATLGKAKILGLMPERHEHTGKNGGPIQYHDLSDEEIDARIAAHETSDVSQPTAH